MIIHGVYVPDNVVPRKISQLIAENNLTYPFVVQKVSIDNSVRSYVVLPLLTTITVVRKEPPTIYDPSMNIYFGYIEKAGYQVYDSPVWILSEASDPNVISMSSYRKFRDAKRKSGK